MATAGVSSVINIYKTQNKNIISKANLDDIFTEIYTKDDVKNIKPNPEVHLKILDTFNFKREECIIIEDTLVGIEAAKRAQIECIAIYDKYSDSNRTEINEKATYTFDNFSELLEYAKKEME